MKKSALFLAISGLLFVAIAQLPFGTKWLQILQEFKVGIFFMLFLPLMLTTVLFNHKNYSYVWGRSALIKTRIGQIFVTVIGVPICWQFNNSLLIGVAVTAMGIYYVASAIAYAYCISYRSRRSFTRQVKEQKRIEKATASDYQ